jgi:hypothetical protein
MLPALQTFVERYGWRAGCTLLAVTALVVLVPLNLLLRRRPETSAWRPTATPTRTRRAARR